MLLIFRPHNSVCLMSRFYFPLRRTLGLVFQSENFNYNRFGNHLMDSWHYMDGPVPEHSKPRLHPGEDLTALTMLYEQCKVSIWK